MKKKFTLVLLVLFAFSMTTFAQKDKSEKVFDDAKYAVKLNGTTLVGLVNPAIEFKVHNYLTVQVDLFGSFYNKRVWWVKKDYNYPLMMGAAWAELRYYPVEAFHGFYIGAHFGGAYYKMNRNAIPTIKKHHEIDNYYQVGGNFMMGYTLGYAFTFKSNPHWGLEISLGGGGHFDKFQNIRQGKPVPAKADRIWYKTKGFVPLYKGGLLVTYRW